MIGISEYQEEKWRLKNPTNDAKEMAKILKEKYGFNSVELILDKDATKQKLARIFEDYIRSDVITGKDRLLVYYSGHGDIRPGKDQQQRPLEESYLIPCDAEPGIYSTYLKMDSITDNCIRCKAKHVLLILDSCFSGAAFIVARSSGEKPKKITDEYLRRISNMRTIQAVAATDKVQPALDSGLTSNHGAFTGCLLDILNDEMDPDEDGILTASEVGAYLEKIVPRRKIPQNPVWGHLPGSEVGEFIFNVFNVSKPNSTANAIPDSKLPLKTKMRKRLSHLLDEGLLMYRIQMKAQEINNLEQGQLSEKDKPYFDLLVRLTEDQIEVGYFTELWLRIEQEQSQPLPKKESENLDYSK